MDECAALGVKSVLVPAAGFGELGGEHLAAEQRIVARAREAGIRLLGPNTFGMFIAGSRVNLTPREHIPPGSVAMLSQSGNVFVGMYEQARQAGIGFSACVGVGNQVDVGLGELLAYFADDPASAAIAVYVEGLRGSGAEFRAGLAACRAAGKPVVVLKSGRSWHAASAVAPPTRALASDGGGWAGGLARAGGGRGGATPDPLDTAGGVEDDPMLLARCARLAAEDEGVDLIVVGGLFGGYPKMLAGELACAAELIKLHRSGHPVVMQSAFALSDAEPLSRLKRAGILVLPTIDRVARALSRTLLPCTSAESVLAGVVGQSAPASGPVMLPVTESTELLRQGGIDIPPISVVRTPRELAVIAATASYPACVKVADTAVAHKSDVGGVGLNLADATEVQMAGDRLWARFPDSPLLVIPFRAGGTEFLVGTGSDPLFGPFVVVGKGGIWAETDADLAILMAPVDEKSARQALLSLRCAPTFTGRRGQPAIDLTAMAGPIIADSRLGAEPPELSVESNPVIAYTDGYAVADVRASRQTGQYITK